MYRYKKSYQIDTHIINERNVEEIYSTKWRLG